MNVFVLRNKCSWSRRIRDVAIATDDTWAMKHHESCLEGVSVKVLRELQNCFNCGGSGFKEEHFFFLSLKSQGEQVLVLLLSKSANEVLLGREIRWLRRNTKE